jgi:hypothetical protein
VAGSVSSQPRQEAAFRRKGLDLPRSASGDNAEFTLTAMSGHAEVLRRAVLLVGPFQFA